MPWRDLRNAGRVQGAVERDAMLFAFTASHNVGVAGFWLDPEPKLCLDCDTSLSPQLLPGTIGAPSECVSSRIFPATCERGAPWLESTKNHPV